MGRQQIESINWIFFCFHTILTASNWIKWNLLSCKSRAVEDFESMTAGDGFVLQNVRLSFHLNYYYYYVFLENDLRVSFLCFIYFLYLLIMHRDWIWFHLDRKKWLNLWQVFISTHQELLWWSLGVVVVVVMFLEVVVAGIVVGLWASVVYFTIPSKSSGSNNLTLKKWKKNRKKLSRFWGNEANVYRFVSDFAV